MGGEGAVGDPHPGRAGPSPLGEDLVDRTRHRGSQRVVAAEVPRRAPRGEGRQPGPGQLDAGGEPLQRGGDGLERPGVATGVGLQHGQSRTSALGLPATLADLHAIEPGPGRGGDHPVGPDHRGRRGRRGSGGDHRPVGAGHHEGADHRAVRCRRCRPVPACHPARRPTGRAHPARLPIRNGTTVESSSPTGSSPIPLLLARCGAGDHVRAERSGRQGRRGARARPGADATTGPGPPPPPGPGGGAGGRDRSRDPPSCPRSR